MKKLFLALALLSLAASSKAGPGGCTNSPTLTPYAFEQITISSTALPLTVAVYTIGGQTPALAVVSVETNGVRYRADGLNPTASVGMPAAAASTWTVCGQQTIRDVRFIRQASDATISVEYYHEGN